MFCDYLAAAVSLEQRRGGLDAQIEIRAAGSVGVEDRQSLLRCARSRPVTAFGLCCEIADFQRFEHPGSLAAYLGIVPSDRTSGEQVKRGAITKEAGSSHARRLLVEAAQHYRH